jgi:hypothetical protein
MISKRMNETNLNFLDRILENEGIEMNAYHRFNLWELKCHSYGQPVFAGTNRVTQTISKAELNAMEPFDVRKLANALLSRFQFAPTN